MAYTMSYRRKSTNRYCNSCGGRSRIIKRRWWRRNNDTSGGHIFLALRYIDRHKIIFRIAPSASFSAACWTENYFSRRLIRRQLRVAACDLKDLRATRVGASGLRYLNEHADRSRLCVAISWGREIERAEKGKKGKFQTAVT